ncbi:MAG: GIY-YIG nuclease family protein [Pseudomonadales bacterium]
MSSTEALTLDGWQVYIARCADNSLYTGVTTDAARREAEHNGQGRKGARYTAVRRPVRIIWVEPAQDRAAACRREAQIKKLTRAQKLSLIAS